jgi:molybdopterin molybdotransferase
MHTSTDIVRDDVESISEKLDSACGTHDAVLTSGGAWKGDRDFVSKVLEQLGWEKVYHRVKIGPGKAVGFGILKGKPVFILPGGPPSNLMAFLQLALPGLLRLAGHKDPRLPQMSVTLMESVKGQIDWTQFIFGRFHERDGSTYFQSLKKVSRLRSMSEADGIVSIPEGVSHIAAGEEVRAQIL